MFQKLSKQSGGRAQVVEYLLRKIKVLCSMLTNAKQRNKQKRAKVIQTTIHHCIIFLKCVQIPFILMSKIY
jgi:hypothetical protein